MKVRSALKFAVLTCLVSTFSQPALSAGPCPGVDAATGAQPTRKPAHALTPTLPDPRPVPAAWRAQALNFLALFESGSPDLLGAYGNVAAIDVISLGFLQWNHNAGSIYDSLFYRAGPDFVSVAPKEIREDIAILVEVGNGRKSKDNGRKILEGWVINGKVRPEIKSAVSTWLASEPVRRRQDVLIDALLSKALRYADAWQRDSGLQSDEFATQKAFYSFADLLTFNGGLDGLWVDHVKTFRSDFDSDREMLEDIRLWALQCQSFIFSGSARLKNGTSYVPKFKHLYRRPETILSLDKWVELHANSDKRVDSAALQLIALGYLRAIRSFGNDKPRGFYGVFQADVLNRRGMMATGIGVLPGEKTPQIIYKLQ